MNALQTFKHNVNVYSLRTAVDTSEMDIELYALFANKNNLSIDKKSVAFAAVAGKHLNYVIDMSELGSYLTIVSIIYEAVDKDHLDYIQFGFYDSLKKHLNEAGINNKIVIGETSRLILGAIKAKYGSK